MTTFGSNLKCAMKMHNIKQKDLAEKLGISRPAVCMIMAGRNSPQLGTILKILRIIPVTFDELVAGVDPDNVNAPYVPRPKKVKEKEPLKAFYTQEDFVKFAKYGQ